MNKKITTYFLLLLFLIITACVSSKTSHKTVVDPKIDEEKLDIIAIMPFARNFTGNEDPVKISNNLTLAIKKRFNKISFVTPNEVKLILKENYYSSDWENFWNDYLEKNIIDENVLATLHTYLKINTLLVGQIIKNEKIDAEYRKRNAARNISVKYSVFSTANRKLIWETIINAEKVNPNSLKKDPPTIESVVDLSIRDLLGELPF